MKRNATPVGGRRAPRSGWWRSLLTLVALVVLASGGVAGAAQPPAEELEDKEVKVFNFEGDTISTDYLKPGTLLVEGLRRGRRSSLIEVRLDFVAEILRSAEDI